MIERVPRFQSGIVLLIALAGSPSCSPQPLPVHPAAKSNSITLRLAVDGALFLEGSPLHRQDLAKEFARIANRLRVDARLDGEPVASDRSLSACIIYQMHGKTPFSTVYEMANEAQSAGFRRWSFIVDSGTIDPPSTQPVGTRPLPVPQAESGDLPLILRTIPIQLHASDRGDAVRIELADREFADFEALRVELTSILSEPENSFDRASLIIDGKLDFAELVRVVNLLASLDLRTIDFKLESTPPPEAR